MADQTLARAMSNATSLPTAANTCHTLLVDEIFAVPGVDVVYSLQCQSLVFTEVNANLESKVDVRVFFSWCVEYPIIEVLCIDTAVLMGDMAYQ